MAPRSAVWKHFTKLSRGEVQCNVCAKKLKSSGNTTNLNNHLKQKHSNLHKCLLESPETVPKKKQKTTANVLEKENVSPLSTTSTETLQSEELGSSTSFDNSDLENGMPSTSAPKIIGNAMFGQLQPRITQAMKTVSSFSEGGSKNVKITGAIVKFIVQDNMPFNTVEGQGFLNLLKETAPLYKVPTRNTIKNMIDKKYDVVAHAFKTIIKNVEYFTITTDVWNADMQTKSFMGVTLHFIKDHQLCSVTLGVTELQESHTAAYIATELSSILNHWEIDINSVVAVVTDNGANMVKACQDLVGNDRHIRCFAHTINLVCEHSIKNTSNLISLIERVRTIVVWFKRSVYASDKLRKVQKAQGTSEGNILKLILDVKTRWNSTFFMIQRFLKLAPLIGNIILSNINAPNMISATELEELKHISQMLFPLEQATREISGEKFVTLSKVIPMIVCLITQYESYQTDFKIASELQTAILKEFAKRFGSVEKSFLLVASTFLDPRFKDIHFKDPNALNNVITQLKKEVSAKNAEECSSSSDLSDENREQSFDLWAPHKTMAHTKKNKKTGTKNNEFTQYLTVSVRHLKENPIEIWEEMKCVYPNLYKLAVQKYLCVVATSVPSERLFSKAGATATKSRNRLTGKRLSKLLFLASIPENVFIW